MCYHKSLKVKLEKLAEYYQAEYDKTMSELYGDNPISYHENGFDFKATPIVTAGVPNALQNFNWGLVPFWVKDAAGGTKLRVSTLNCISEEMYDKPSFRDSAKEGKRCLIPSTGFYEWRWMDEKGKTKIPYHIHFKDQELFSIAGLYAKNKNMGTSGDYHSYAVLTTRANTLMTKIHNSKKRMPVIIPKQYEKDWLNPALSKDDVLALCNVVHEIDLDAHTISKRITDKKESSDVPEVLLPHVYEEVRD
ncbi:SOS response-associated peptidase [Pseudochryseolinea flava]|uniref:Abasic site processing protein n=1 Tax=Pseudochryseolinea flava TaxID=2059302 RepID=A0A364XXD0_9BACT|nr:SOS response-associated peptidase [Pseudochryseolinea flava]RAV98874.1 SOS response-associated peptidase [Pseudochryseolinea flava]